MNEMKSISITLLCMSLYDLVLNKYCSKFKSNYMSCILESFLGRELALTNETLLPKSSTLLFLFPILLGLSTMKIGCGFGLNLV